MDRASAQPQVNRALRSNSLKFQLQVLIRLIGLFCIELFLYMWIKSNHTNNVLVFYKLIIFWLTNRPKTSKESP
jgi:hypothetical protein